MKLAALSALALTLLLNGASAQEPVTIRFWTNAVAQSPSFDKEIELFEKANPGIEVERTTTGGAQYTQVFDLAFKSSNAPDVFTLTFDNLSGGFNQVRDAGWIMPLNTWATEQWQATFPRGSFTEGVNVFDGQILSVPWNARGQNTIQLYINNQVFRDAGLVDENGEILIPKTWADERKFAKQITDRSGGETYGWGFGAKQGDYAITLQSWSARLSGATCNNYACQNLHTGRYEYSSNPTWQAWFDHWLDLKEDGSIYPQSAVVDDEQARVLFAEGQFGMYINGPWVPSSLKQTNPDFTDYTVVQLPTREGEASSYLYADPSENYMAISSQSKNPEAAWKFYSWLNSKESAMRWASYGEGARVWPETVEALTGKAADVARIANTNTRITPSFTAARPQIAEVKQQTPTQNLGFYILAAYSGQLARDDVPTALKKLEDDWNSELERAVAEARENGVEVSVEDFAFETWNPQIDQTTLK